MMDDEELVARYGERGVPNEWQDITPPSLAPAFRLWYRALPSPKTKDMDGADQALRDAADEAEALVHDPLTALREVGIIGTEEEPHISTLVVNHEKTLNRFIMHTMVLASTNPNTVGIVIAKEEE